MSSETSRKPSSGPHPRKQASLPEFGHATLNWLGQDLLELEFGLGSEASVRWALVGFSCGLRLASLESGHAKKLLRECGSDHRESLLAEIVLPQVGRRPLTVTDELSKLGRVFVNLLTDPPSEIRSELTGLDSAQQFAWWFRHSVIWGLQAGLNADSLFTGRMLAFLERLPINQRFISDRLTFILRAERRLRRPALVEFFDYTYPRTPIERTTIVGCAEKILEELAHWNKSGDIADWILCGFREGLILSTRNVPLRKRIFAESTRGGMQAVWSLFAEYVGPEPSGWQPKRLVRETLAWLRKVHPNLEKPNCRAVEFERIREVFDFAFWMGLVAGTGDKSTD